MRLTIYKLYDNADPEIRPAGVKRDWMDATPESYAYRCLPLNMANLHAWEIPCQVTSEITWNGGSGLDAITIKAHGPEHLAPISHFGSGVLTFHIPALIRTEPGYNLFVSGPLNGVKDGIAPLTGIVETDWSPYTFTMNWKITRPNRTIIFEKGDPYCVFFAIPRGLAEQTEPVVEPIRNNPELHDHFKKWYDMRNDFNKALNERDAEAAQKKWQKLYYLGLLPDESEGCPMHQIKLKLKETKNE